MKEKMKTVLKPQNIDRPREKLEKKGVSALNNQELVMLILGSGIKGRNVAQQSADILKLLDIEGGNISFAKLKSISGIGTAKAGQIMASFELAKRYLIKQSNKIHNVDDILKLVEDIREPLITPFPGSIPFDSCNDSQFLSLEIELIEVPIRDKKTRAFYFFNFKWSIFTYRKKSGF